MTNANSSPIGRRRERNHRQTSARIVGQPNKGHAGLVQDAAATLCNSEPKSKVRATLRKKTAAARAQGFKELLESAPLDGIDIERSRDFGRDFPS